MPSFSDLPEGEGFLLVAQTFKSAVSQVFNLRRAGETSRASRLEIGDMADYKPALQSPTLPHWSPTLNLPRSRAAQLKDQSMLTKVLILPALAGLFLVAPNSHATTITQDFAGSPLTNGWSVFGDSNLFLWDATSQNLHVTWDSTRSNTYFHHPLGTVLTRHDDFSFAFDLRLNDIASGVEPGKTGPLQLGFGFLNYTNATSTDFIRGGYGKAPNVAGFDYYAWGFFDFGGTIFESPAATPPAFISGVNRFAYAPVIVASYNHELPTNQTVRVTMAYTASNQTVAVTIHTNGQATVSLPNLVLNSANGFEDTDDFYVDIFSISSFSSAGDDYNSILAHGTVDNVVVTLPPPVQNLTGGFSNGIWQVAFASRSNWLYTLERTVDFAAWANASLAVPGNASNLSLLDTNPPVGQAFYRVRAARP
jgi:hypothetical protein